MSADDSGITVSLSAVLAAKIHEAVERGDASNTDEFVAGAIQHELIRLRDESKRRTSPLFAAANDDGPEEVGIGWEALMPKPNDSIRDLLVQDADEPHDS